MKEHSNHEVICSYCGDKISSRGDLVTLLAYPQIVDAVHVRCYGEMSTKRMGGKLPLNSSGSLWIIIISDLICLYLFITRSYHFVFILVGCLAPFLRFLSWFMVERKIR
ncbi:hypothetical protein SAMN05421799_101249 [Alicyclobacillus vulcanalis]|uniref:Uncharacterized protein n=1 Tax=Alicyclobacillus vulcanalis TaxID=252246 RepID=A0A1N7JYU6_9BACL|nr:hypothetical protein SAMN05421799_101249 [Alicyclobacillus vulcanalis]